MNPALIGPVVWAAEATISPGAALVGVADVIVLGGAYEQHRIDVRVLFARLDDAMAHLPLAIIDGQLTQRL